MAVNLHTTHFRFGIDELAENTHGWHAAEDTSPAQGVIVVNTPFLLRFNVQETGATAAANTDFTFECRKNAGAFQAVTTTSSIVKAVAATALTNGSACTKRLSGTGTFESSGAGQTEDGTSGGAANDIAASGCSETECGLQLIGTDVTANDVIQFRLTSPDFTITNDVIPSITIAGTTTLEADGVSAGLSGSSVAGAMLSVGMAASSAASTPNALGASVMTATTAASGLAAGVVMAVALWNSASVSSSVSAASAISSATAQSDGSATGFAVALGRATNTEPADGFAIGTASGAWLGAWYALANGTGVGVGTASGLMAVIAAGVGVSSPAGSGSSGQVIND